MSRFSRPLVALAVVSWTATAVAQLVAVLAAEESERIEWSERRNLFLLCSSLATNALVLTTAYRYAKRWRRDRLE